MHKLFGILLAAVGLFSSAAAESLLSGTIISDTRATSYASLAFDGDVSTRFRSDNPSHAWVGLQFDEPQVITRVRWYNYAGTYSMTVSSQRTSMPYSQLAVFEGANNADFTDALPLYLVTSSSTTAGWNEAEVNVDRGFRYVRYVGPNSSYGRVYELEFYGEAGEGGDTQFYQPTNLPLLVVHTQTGDDMADKVTNLDAEAYVIYTSKKGKSKVVGGAGTIRGRGNASWDFPKKPFRIKFAEKVEMPNGGAKAKKWTLINSYGDKTLMRNILAYDMSRRMEMPYTTYCQPVDVILNGEYVGNYELCDQLEVNKNRVNIDEMDATCTSGDELTGGYFYEYDGNWNAKTLSEWQALSETDQATYDVGFKTSKTNPITIKSPDEDEMQQTQFDYLKDYLNTVETQVYAGSASLPDYLDLETFARFFIVGEFTGNTDTFYEMYQYKKRGDQRAYFGPCWDFDLAYDNDNRTHSYLNNTSNTGWICNNGGSYIERYAGCGAMSSYVNKILANATTTQKLQENWAYVRATDEVSSDALVGAVALLVDSLQQSQELNFTRWPILSTKVHQNYQALGSWSSEVSTITSYILKRVSWMDSKLSLTEASCDLTLTDAEWATLYVPYAVPAPEGLTFYTPTDVDADGVLQLEEVSTTRPNRPYLVHGAAGTYTLPCYSVAATDGESLGLLTGSQSGTEVPVGGYVLQRNNGRTCFYRVDDDQTIRIGAQRAYLTLPDEAQQAGIRAFYFDDDEAGLDDLHLASGGTLSVYSLTGTLLRLYTGSWDLGQMSRDLGTGTYVLSDGTSSRTVTF